MKTDATFNDAKQLYMEQYASAIVSGVYLKIAIAVLSLVVLSLVLMNLKVVRTLENFKPLVVRIDELGRAQAVAYESLSYKPEYKETKYFLTRFCQLYYRRNHSTINDDFSQSMYFLDGKLPATRFRNSNRRASSKPFSVTIWLPNLTSTCSR
jgi:type IV secretory pathway TrbF-like protein